MNASVLETFRLANSAMVMPLARTRTCSNALYHEVTIAVSEGREFLLSVEELIAVGGQVGDELRFGDRQEEHA